jgi:hypothetical protein
MGDAEGITEMINTYILVRNPESLFLDARTILKRILRI